MKKFLNYKSFFAIALMAITFTGCDYDQDYPDPNKPVVTATTNVTINEGDTGNITLTLSKAIGSDIDLKLRPIDASSTAEKDSDYTVEAFGEYTSADDGVGDVPAYHIVIPLGATTFDIPVSAIGDLDAEESETITFELTSTGNGMSIVEESSQLITVTITNDTSKFSTTLSWDGTYLDADGDEHDLCDLDLDLEIYTSDFASIVATSYSSCPESIIFSPGDLEDGTYYIVPSFWSNGGTVAPAENFDIPAMISFSQAGIDNSVSVSLGDLWNYDTGGAAQDNADAYYVNYELVVEGDSFTVKDSDGNIVFEQ